MPHFSCLPFEVNAVIAYLACARVLNSSTKLRHARVKYSVQGVVLGVALVIAKTPYCEPMRGSRYILYKDYIGMPQRVYLGALVINRLSI